MARSSQSLRARVTQATGRRRKKPANPIQRAFDDLKNLVTEAAGRPANRQTAAKKAAGERQRTGRRRQEAAKQTAARRRSKSR